MGKVIIETEALTEGLYLLKKAGARQFELAPFETIGPADLQKISDQGNATNNVIQITGLGKIDISKGSLMLGYRDNISRISHVQNNDNATVIYLQENEVVFKFGGPNSFRVLEPLAYDGVAGEFSGRVVGASAIYSTEFMTLGQYQELAKRQRGVVVFSEEVNTMQVSSEVVTRDSIIILTVQEAFVPDVTAYIAGRLPGEYFMIKCNKPAGEPCVIGWVMFDPAE